MAAQPIIGFNYGAKLYSRVKDTLFIAMKAATLIAVGGWLIVELFPGIIVKAFNTDNTELFEIGIRGLRILLIALPIIGFQIIVGNYFQSIGKAKISALLSLLRQVLLLIPAILIFPRFWGLNGVWISAPICDSISAMIVSVFLFRELKRLNFLIKKQETNSE